MTTTHLDLPKSVEWMLFGVPTKNSLRFEQHPFEDAGLNARNINQPVPKDPLATLLNRPMLMIAMKERRTYMDVLRSTVTEQLAIQCTSM